MNPIRTLLLDDNLMSATRVEGGLKAAGCAVTLARRLPATLPFELIVLNLGSRSLGGLGLVSSAQKAAPDAAVWGFCGHREVEIWRAAQGAGVKMISNERAMSEIAGEVEAWTASRP